MEGSHFRCLLFRASSCFLNLLLAYLDVFHVLIVIFEAGLLVLSQLILQSLFQIQLIIIVIRITFMLHVDGVVSRHVPTLEDPFHTFTHTRYLPFNFVLQEDNFQEHHLNRFFDRVVR